MKKVFLILMSFAMLVACSTEDDGFSFVILPVEGAVVPETMVVGEEHDIEVSYLMPEGCYTFNDFYYEVSENTRTIAIISLFNSNITCESQSSDGIITRTFTFVPEQATTYLFRFWTGQNSQGVDEYIEHQVTAE